MGGGFAGVAIPFTVDQFLSVFEQYHRAIGPAPVVAYALGVVALALALRGDRAAGRTVPAILALFWATSGAAYHLTFFRRINPAAVAFGVLVVMQAALLAAVALRREPLSFRFRPTCRHGVGLAIAAYALVAYPLLGAAAGHGYPRGPSFGTTPCPTTLFTFALLLLAEGRPPALLVGIPLLWSIVGASAAAQLGMREDYGLAVAGLAAAALIAVERWRARRAGPVGAGAPDPVAAAPPGRR
jgi:hypothetical protein